RVSHTVRPSRDQCTRWKKGMGKAGVRVRGKACDAKCAGKRPSVSSQTRDRPPSPEERTTKGSRKSVPTKNQSTRPMKGTWERRRPCAGTVQYHHPAATAADSMARLMAPRKRQAQSTCGKRRLGDPGKGDRTL